MPIQTCSALAYEAVENRRASGGNDTVLNVDPAARPRCLYVPEHRARGRPRHRVIIRAQNYDLRRADFSRRIYRRCPLGLRWRRWYRAANAAA
jgi:hypothetical protein